MESNTLNIFLQEEKNKPYFTKIMKKVKTSEKTNVIYPTEALRFRAYESAPKQIKVIICASEPYCEPNSADGLALSSLYNKTSSLTNVFRKIEDELKINCNKDDTDLIRWTTQGVLLLNISLTCAAGRKGSHKEYGWQELTYNTIKKLYEDNSPKVFILLGAAIKARGYSMKVANTNHLVLTGAEPDDADFFKNNYFKATQDFLKENNMTLIDWR